MTKRFSNCENSNIKKPKLDDDLWDDDFNVEDFESCIAFAKQCSEQNFTQQNNGSLPTYNVFIQPTQNLFTSTQNTFGLIASVPSTSAQKKDLISKADDEVKKLREDCLAKEGEVTILRTQLKEIKSSYESAQAKLKQQWTEKLNLSVAQMKSTQCDLEFKNLEIANLKQKLIDVIKRSNLDLTLNETFSPVKKVKLQGTINSAICPQKCESTRDFVIDVIPQEPAVKITSEIFNSQVQMKENKLNYGTFINISELIQNSVGSNKQSIMHLTKTICISQKLINDLKISLQKMENVKVKNKNKQVNFVVNMEQAVFDEKECCVKELGVNARRSIASISKILPFSNYLQGFLLDNKEFILSEQLKTSFPNLRNNEFIYLNSILSVTRIIRELNKAEYCVGFLFAVLMLCNELCVVSKCTSGFPVIISIIKEIALSNINLNHVYFSKFLKNASKFTDFIEGLCNMKGSNDNSSAVKFPNKCLMEILAAIFESKTLKNLNTRAHTNMLEFSSNILNSDISWIYYQETQHCKCLCKLNKISIDVIFTLIKNYDEGNRKCIIKMLHIFNFKSPDLVVRCIDTYAQYKVIVKSLLDRRETLKLSELEVEALQDLNHEEVMLSNLQINNIPLWKRK